MTRKQLCKTVSAWLVSPVYHLAFGQVESRAYGGRRVIGRDLPFLQGRGTEFSVSHVK